jgi:muconate cycloisomerase
MTETIDRILAPAVIGTEVGNFALMHRQMDAAITGHQRLKAAIETAAYDLMGKALGVPVWKLVGGKIHDAIPVLGWVMASTAEEYSKRQKRMSTPVSTRLR